jgi:hypothetical protein
VLETAHDSSPLGVKDVSGGEELVMGVNWVTVDPGATQVQALPIFDAEAAQLAKKEGRGGCLCHHCVRRTEFYVEAEAP